MKWWDKALIGLLAFDVLSCGALAVFRHDPTALRYAVICTAMLAVILIIATWRKPA